MEKLTDEVKTKRVISEKTCEAVYDTFEQLIRLHDDKRTTQGLRTGRMSSMSPPLTVPGCLRTLEQNLGGNRMKLEDVTYVCKTVKQYIEENK